MGLDYTALAAMHSRRSQGLEYWASVPWSDTSGAVDPLSVPIVRTGGFLIYRRNGPVAQGIEQQPSKLKVAGSNPAGVANIINSLYDIFERTLPRKPSLGSMSKG